MTSKQAAMTAVQKKFLCEKKRDNPSLTQQQLVEIASKEFQITPSLSAIQRLLKEKEKFLHMRDKDFKKRRMRPPKYPQLEAAVDLWFSQVDSPATP